MAAQLFTPLRLRGVEFRNRVFVSPMCQYSASDGVPNDWHLVHLGSRAVGGAALVLTEKTAVTPEGRITPGCTGIWNDAQGEAWTRITAFIRGQGAEPGIQLGHAGRKASTAAPWHGGKPLAAGSGAWRTVGPSAVPFADDWPVPRALTADELAELAARYGEAARRAAAAGFRVVEIHAAHGYLLHQFLSPLSNRRDDGYGGALDGRMRFPLAVARAVREAFPADLPVLVRISATDWVEGGWDLPQSVELARRLKALGVDLIDCSSGGNVPGATIPLGPGYQVPFAAAVRRDARIPTGAVGLITEPRQAEAILAEGSADAVLLARQLLREPYWPLRAARELGVELDWPVQYRRAKPS